MMHPRNGRYHRWKIVSPFMILFLAGFCFTTGCESNNPENIYAQRHDLPTPVPEAPRVEGAPGAEEARPQPVVVEKKREPAFQMRPATLVSSNPDYEVAGATKLDLRAMVPMGEVALKSNDGAFQSQSPMLFDGDFQSLAKSESINPVFLEFEFQKPIRLKAVRMLFSHTVSHNWAVHTDPKKNGTMVRDAPDQQWSRMDFSPSETTQWVRMEMLRTSGDDFVHLNEIEFYVEN